MKAHVDGSVPVWILNPRPDPHGLVRIITVTACRIRYQGTFAPGKVLRIKRERVK